MKVYIKDPDGNSISFDIIEYEERIRLMNSEVDKLHKVDKSFFKNEIYLLKNGDFLHIYTADAYVFKFCSENDLNKFINNGDHSTAGVIRDKQTRKIYYTFRLFSHKSLELVEKIVKEIPGYPSNFDKKLCLLNDGTYLRVSKRNTVNLIYDGDWYPDLETFEWYYKNGMAE
jgi:hypothetical protein